MNITNEMFSDLDNLNIFNNVNPLLSLLYLKKPCNFYVKKKIQSNVKTRILRYFLVLYMNIVITKILMNLETSLREFLRGISISHNQI